MIDIEPSVISAVQTSVRTSYPTLTVYPEYIRIPASFPHITVIEGDNRSYSPSATSGFANNHAVVMYTVDVYSNRKNAKKAEAKAIMALADSAMLALGFFRISNQPLPNVADSTIYRIVARYRAVVSASETIHPI